MGRKLYFLMIGLIMVLPTLACGAVGVYEPEATQVAIEGTVTALQATITALEKNIGPAQSNPTEIQVVTATSTPTSPPPAGSSTVILASSLEQTIQLTSTPTPTPITITSQDRVVTLVATFTPSPTPEQHADAPIIIAPQPGTIVEEEREILLQWSWNGILKTDEYFDIKIKQDGQDRSVYVRWERGQGHNFRANLPPGRYFWTVQVLKGSYKNNSSEPEDRIFEGFTSPESEAHLIIVSEKDRERKRTPTPTSTRADVGGSGDTDDTSNSSSSQAESTPEPADGAESADPEGNSDDAEDEGSSP